MKALLLRYSSRTRTLPIRLPAWAMVLASSWSLLAAPEVRTLTGGPSEIFPLGAAGYVDGDTATVAQFNTPYGIALDPTGNTLYVADRDNNAIRRLDLPGGQTYTFATNRINQPVGVAVDGDGKVYVLNRGNGNNGTVLTFDSPTLGGDFLAMKASNLVNANGIALDSLTNIYVTVQGNTVIRITPAGVSSTLATIANAGASLQGITVRRDGRIAVCDAGRHGIYLIDPTTGAVTNHAGFHGAGDFASGTDNVASSSTAQFNQPYGVAAAGDGTLVVTDNGNNRVKAVLANGVVTNIYGVSSNFWVQGSASQGIFPGWWDGSVAVRDIFGTVEARSPVGVLFAPNGTVYTTETYYHLIRTVTGTGLPLPPPPPEPVPPPRIGWVDFTVPPALVISVLQSGTAPNFNTFTFNNDKIIAIEGIDGTETHYTVGATSPGVDTVPNPSPTSGSTPPVYHDGLFPAQVPPSIITPQPDVTVKAIDFQTGRPSSLIIQARFIFKTASPVIFGENAAQFKVDCETVGAQMWYTTDGSDPINAPPSVGPITPPANLSLNITTNTTFKIRAFRDHYQPGEVSVQTFSPTNYNANKITFGFDSGEASSDFVASPGQLFYAPVTLSILPGTPMYSLQFNVTLTNINPAPLVTPGAVDFVSLLVKPAPASTFVRIPPAMFLGVTTNFVLVTNTFGTNQIVFTNEVIIPANFDPPPTNRIIYPYDGSPFLDLRFVNSSENLIGVGWLERAGRTNLYDTTTQDLIKFSLPHDTLFDESGGKVVLGGYAFRVPGTAAPGAQYRIQIGRPSATSDGIGRPGSDVFIDSPTNGSLAGGTINSIKRVTAGQRRYIAGDSAPFRWFNAGDFGNTNLLNSDVVQVFQSAIYNLNYPPPGSDFFDAMDSCCGTYVTNNAGYLVLGTNITDTATLNGLFDGDDRVINTIAFGDGTLDVTDIYVTFRRSLDPDLFWFQRFWTNGVRAAQRYPNGGPLPTPPAPITVAVTPEVTFSAGDAIASSGQTVLIPINAQIRGDYPLRIMALGLTVQPLDGSPAITTSVQFLDSALGSPDIGDSRGPANFAATWLNRAVTGLSGDVRLGTLQVTLPANCPADAAYAIHFDHASASPNGIVPFPRQVRTGLLTRSDRSASSFNDGIPDAWRLRYFGTLNNLLSQATADADGDGADNWQEYKAGTDPNDRASVLRASSSKAPGSQQPFTIRWPSVEGIRYVVDRSVTLFDGSWSPVATKDGTGLEIQFQDGDSVGNIQYFYRVRVAE